MSLLAIGWEPELRGLLTVVIGFVILMGSVYAIMATNMGARLAFLVAFAGLAGWMMLMGLVWWIYGIGLRGPDPTWQPVAGATVLQDSDALVSGGALEELPDIPEVADFNLETALVSQQFVEEGYIILDPAAPAFGQAQASAAVYFEEQGAFAPGTYAVTNIYDIGGDRFPRIKLDIGALNIDEDTLDFFAFWHEPHYVVVEARPFVPVREEPGRAPVSPRIDEDRQAEYVYMIRDLGARRQPAVALTIGGGVVFFALCYLLHRRERILQENLSDSKAVATA